MKLFAKLKGIQGKSLNLEIGDDLNLMKIQKLSAGSQPTVELDISDGRSISNDQRKKIYALIADISIWSGYSVEKEMPQIMKWQYLMSTGEQEFSLSDCSMTQANKYLSWILDFCFDNDIPFKTKTWDLLPNDFAMQYRCLKHRKCCICGKHADIAHLKTVGLGRSRKRINHSDYYFMALCRTHHTEQHKIGIKTFLTRYHIKPVKLQPEDIKQLHIGG
ncbi:putative HNHc nuclease [Companilactobacillus mishanensis]|uniref:DUF968 domain-containing protein n=1 Tax=Companilactobacillus mishanensis TaxID=2486008 RepID=A0A5P0ZF69_9LACO|nr:putative HNHc nuclease [Companilactobacillus mishanensis]MQS44272.1 hypothetical protein [Companilactobacillus mishanensis]MQS51625.1 hypothetical protein [Companilactobacillus mishanensis]